MNLMSICNKVKAKINKDIKLIRFPGGSGNIWTKDINVGIMSRLTNEVKKRKLIYFDWNIDSQDEKLIKKNDIVNNCINNIGNENVICIRFNEGANNKNTIDALPIIIDSLIEKGFKFKTLSSYSFGFKQDIKN